MDTNNDEKIRERCDFILERYENAKEKGLIDKAKIPELNEIAKKLYISDDKVEMYSLHKQLKQGMYDYMYANDKVNYTEDREYNTEASETKKSKAIKLKSEDKKKFSDFWEEKKQKRLDKIQKQIDKKENIKEKFEQAMGNADNYSNAFEGIQINAKNKAYAKRIASLESDITYLKNHYEYVSRNENAYNRAIILLSKPFSVFYSVTSWIKSKLGIDIKSVAKENEKNIDKAVQKGFDDIENESSNDHGFEENNFSNNIHETVSEPYPSENIINDSNDVVNGQYRFSKNNLEGNNSSNDIDEDVDQFTLSDVEVPSMDESNQQNDIESDNSNDMDMNIDNESKIDEIIKNVVIDDETKEQENDNSVKTEEFKFNEKADVQIAPQRVVQDAPTLTATELPKVTSEDLKNMLDEFKNDYKNSTVNEYGMGSDFEYEIDKEEIKEEATNAYGRYQEKETEIKNRVDELYKSQVPNGITLSEEQEKRLKDILRKQVEKEDAVAESMRKEEERRQKEEEMQRKVAEASEQYTNKYLETKKRQLQQLDMKKDKYDNAAVKSNSQIDVLEEQLRILSSKTSELDEMFNESTNESSENHSISM